MAIKVVDLVMSLRYALGDMQGLNISDYELIEPINQAVNKLFGYLNERHIHEVVTETAPTQITTGNPTISLPDTFVRIYQVLGVDDKVTTPTDNDYQVIIPTTSRKLVFGAYRIIGRELKAAKGTYIIEYYYKPKRVQTLGDADIEASESLRPWIEQLALAFYRKDYATADALVKQCENVLAGREITQFENMGVAQTLGARAVQ